MEPVISVRDLWHRYGKRVIHQGLSFDVGQGEVVALLGKNGVGKTTLIQLLMGFMRPWRGEARIFGERSNALTPSTRRRVGLLFEGHQCHDYLSIDQFEAFHRAFYPAWDRDVFYGLVNLLGLKGSHRPKDMSCGQRSQVVLGALLAQKPELLILDDYSMGLDAGYRRLFVDYLKEHLRESKATVFLTSHVIEDMDSLVDRVLFLRRGGAPLLTNLSAFKRDFCAFRLPRFEGDEGCLEVGGALHNLERHADYWELFTFEPEKLKAQLASQSVPGTLTPQAMTLEDAFIGYTGRY